MKTIVLISLCLCLIVSTISAEKSHKLQGKPLKSGLEEHKKQADIQPLAQEEAALKLSNPASDQVLPVKPAAGRNQRKNHHGKTKKRTNAETHTSRSRKTQTKPHKQNGQRPHNKHGRKHGRGKQA